MTVCFTGHRKLEPQNIVQTASLLEEKIDRLAKSCAALAESVDFRAGGAVGFDTLAALCVLTAKETYPNIKLHLFLPCKDQTYGWSDGDIEKYNYILSQADSVIYVSEKRSSGCMLKRDRALVDGADLCIAYCNKTTGGTAYTVSYAKERGVEVENIYK